MELQAWLQWPPPENSEEFSLSWGYANLFPAESIRTLVKTEKPPMNFKTEFDTVGYVIVDDAIDPAMAQPLLTAARRVFRKCRIH